MSRVAAITALAKSADLSFTDFVVSEAVTLASVRSGAHVALRVLDLVDRSAGFRFEWIDSTRFEAAKAYFRTHADHKYSFTD